MDRSTIIAGNWKMNMTAPESVRLAQDLAARLGAGAGPEIAVCPPFLSIRPVAEVLGSTRILVGAQNMHWEASGAYTGEVSAGMLLDAGADMVILGHSERRHGMGEDDAMVNRKLRAALGAGLRPIVCVGETLEERESGRTDDVVLGQVRGSLAGLSAEEARGVVVAYEPVWAIGTGKTATPDQAQEVHAAIRGVLTEMLGEPVAAAMVLQYGGSVKPGNAADLLGRPDIDGALVGGASLDADSFAKIVEAAP
jgi:triosephosphate isomerase